MTKKDLKPQNVFNFFEEINNIPRPSKHEEKMIEYLKNFGESRNLETIVDEAGNVLIRKPATKGMEGRTPLIIQSHMDMVCDKVAGHEIDFLKDPIVTYIDEEGWLRAKGTTLGADDGIGCAMELAILDDDTIEHGDIECLFTRDEEQGMTGAFAMKSDLLKGNTLLNLDSEDEGLFYVSCAGGRTTTATFIYNKVEAPKGYFFLEASIKGLCGGHSGDDINKKRANANKLLGRFLYEENKKMPLYLVSFNGGKLHNAITREASIVFAVPFAEKENVRVDWNVFASNVEDEFIVTESGINWHMESTDAQPVIEKEKGDKIIAALQAVHNGVFAMVQNLELGDITETSSNLAVVKTEDKEDGKGEFTILASQRSSLMSNLDNVVNTVSAVMELAGADTIIHNDGYPAWKMNPNSRLREVAKECYKSLYGKDAKIIGIHAGLECALFSERYPTMDMVSMGPTMRGVHSPDERLEIESVGKVWDLVLEILKKI